MQRPLFYIATLAWLFFFQFSHAFDVVGTSQTRIKLTEIAKFNEPWAMASLPDGSLLITQKTGELLLLSKGSNTPTPVAGVPKVDYGGQGGLGDIILHPRFMSNRNVYLSFIEAGKFGRRGAVVALARLSDDGSRLENLKVIWRQVPKVSGHGHYSHRLAFSPDGYLFITSGDRQKLTPAQDMGSNLGKIIRLKEDGSLPPDNPWQDAGDLTRSFWSIGHRNLLGIAFDGQGRLWQHEMGPRHGDELNLVKPGKNYGWPTVSEGSHYSGLPIPSHNAYPKFAAPETYWVPTIAPSGMVIYTADKFDAFRSNALIGGLASRALIRVGLSDGKAREIERFEWQKRIREVEVDGDGIVYLLEDGQGARLLKITHVQVP